MLNKTLQKLQKKTRKGSIAFPSVLVFYHCLRRYI